ncbi:MAG: alpha/beta hydrolase [Candidatus Pristimantibacillus sp.]
MHIVAIIIGCLLLIAVVILTVGCFYFYNLAISRKSKDFLTGHADLVEMPVEEESWLQQQDIEKVSLQSYDDLKLRGHWLPAAQLSSITIIIAHGYSGHGMLMDSLARMYHEHFGYNVLMPDNRGHGESEGNYIGFGWHDRKDYLKWIDYVIDRKGANEQIGLHGVSMGGAAVLMTSGEQLPAAVKAIVSDCAYTTVEDQLRYQLKRMFKLPSFPFVMLTSVLCRYRAGYSFAEASALKQVAKATKPILFIHGDQDAFVPTEMVNRLYEQCNSEKELHIVPGAGHGLAYLTDPGGYIKAVRSFFQKHFSLAD